MSASVHKEEGVRDIYEDIDLFSVLSPKKIYSRIMHL